MTDPTILQLVSELQTFWTQAAGEPVKVCKIDDTVTAEGSELGALRLFASMRRGAVVPGETIGKFAFSLSLSEVRQSVDGVNVGALKTLAWYGWSDVDVSQDGDGEEELSDPHWKINIDRDVTTYERFTRFVRAKDETEAMDKARALLTDAILAIQAGGEIPDVGDTNNDPDLGEFYIQDVELADPHDLDSATELEMVDE